MPFDTEDRSLTGGPLVSIKRQDERTGERFAQVNASLDVRGTLTQNGEAVGDGAGGGGISGLTTGQNVVAASATTIATDGVKRYVALLSQSGTDAPVETVLENTLGGTPVWGYVDEGIYSLTLTGAFVQAKTFIVTPTTNEDQTGLILSGVLDVNTIRVRAFADGALANGLFDFYAYEIRVYP